MAESTIDHPAESGIVYLIGAGPGDPGLITVKGLEKIRTADVVVYDYLADKKIIAEAPSGAELIYVGKKGSDHTAEQPDINQILVQKSGEGKRVARVKGGDPFVFGRGGEEAEELANAGVRFEIVPGVTSAVAAPAYAGIPVTHRDHASSVTFITGHEDPNKPESAIDWGNLANNPGSLVFLMGVKNLKRICESLISHGKDPQTPAGLIRWGTTPNQVSLLSTLEHMPGDAHKKGIMAPAIFIVGSVALLGNRLAWWERKPLYGRRILITRSKSQSAGMADRISQLAGAAVLFPTIEITDPDDFQPLDTALNRISEYDWIIFTSVNGVERFFDRYFQLKDDIRELAGPNIGAIGPVTASKLRDLRLKVNALAKEFKAEGLLAEFEKSQVQGKRFLIPRAQEAREILPQGLAEMGGIVDVTPVYKTIIPRMNDTGSIIKMLSEKSVHAVTFTSSSTVTHFIETLGSDSYEELLKGIVLASIGPITSRTLELYSLKPQIEAKEYTMDGLVKAMSDYFANL
jgi:uroporphyrinogen III methyltransferase/synthase